MLERGVQSNWAKKPGVNPNILWLTRPFRESFRIFADCQNVWPFSAKRLAAVIKWRQSPLLAAPPDFASGRGYGEC